MARGPVVARRTRVALALTASTVALVGCGGSHHRRRQTTAVSGPVPIFTQPAAATAPPRLAEIGEVVDAHDRVVRRIESRLRPNTTAAIQAAVADGHGGWFVAEQFNGGAGLLGTRLAHMLESGDIDRRWPAVRPDDVVTALAASPTTLYVAVTKSAPPPPLGSSPSGLGPTRLLAYSAATGAPRPAPAVPRFPITAMAVSRGLLLVGLASGTRRQDPSCLVAYDLASGEPAREFHASIKLPVGYGGNACVQVLAVRGDRVYVGGVFARVGEIKEPSLARLDLPSGAVDRSWHPDMRFGLGTPALAVGAGEAFLTGGNATIRAVSTRTGAPDRHWVWPPRSWGGQRVTRSTGFTCCGAPLTVTRGLLLIAAHPGASLAAIRVRDGAPERFPSGPIGFPVWVAAPSGQNVLAGFEASAPGA